MKSLIQRLLLIYSCIAFVCSTETNYCNRASDQLRCFNETQKSNCEKSYKRVDLLTTPQGQPLGDAINVKTVGPRGQMLLEDVLFIKELQQFDRERIPERVVHARGAGAHGYFEVTKPEIQKYSKAVVFKPGNKTKIFVRFSQVAGELGAADTVRDVRGFAIKFYTEDGIWDLVGNNLPVFFIRDPRLFPSFIHSQKRNPQTHLPDPNMAWDFFTLRNESMLQVMHLFSDLGIPASYRHMNGFGVHTFKLVNSKGEAFFCKFNYETNQGIKNLTGEEGMKIAGQNPDHLLQDLYDAIARNDYPSWTLYFQIMTTEQAKTWKYNPFDTTKLWPREEFPYIEVGRLVLNENPKNYFAETEQSAFAPANMIAGIEPSPEKLLQGRLFSYLDTQIYRLGKNFNRIRINEPIYEPLTPTARDGASVIENYEGMPNYYPNSFLRASPDPDYKEHSYKVDSDIVDRHEFDNQHNLVQAGEFFNALSKQDQENTVKNLVTSLKNVYPFIQKRAIRIFKAIDLNLGIKVQERLPTEESKSPIN